MSLAVRLLMIDFRHHSLTIVAIFMMLGVGILIGERLALPAQIKQQTKTLAVLQEQVDGAVQDGREAKRRLAHIEHAIDVLRARVVPGKLAGKRVEIVVCGDYPQAAYAAATALTDAGATSAAQIDITDKLVEINPDERGGLLQSMTSTDQPADPTAQIPADVNQTDLLRPLMAVLHTGTDASEDGASMIATLVNQRDISVSGDISQPCSLFVVIGGRNEDGIPPESLVADTESGIVAGLLDQGMDVSVVGCEPLDAVISSIPNYQKEQIPTVDCIDQPLGELDLPFALRGDKADYGLKSTAGRELPASLEEQNHP